MPIFGFQCKCATGFYGNICENKYSVKVDEDKIASILVSAEVVEKDEVTTLKATTESTATESTATESSAKESTTVETTLVLTTVAEQVTTKWCCKSVAKIAKNDLK